MINSFPDSEGQDAEAESKQNGALEFCRKTWIFTPCPHKNNRDQKMLKKCCYLSHEIWKQRGSRQL